jgi:hypothetical protein
MRHERPQLGTICQAEDLNTVLMEERGEGIARALAEKLLVHLDKAADHPIGVRRLDGSYIESTLGRLLPLLAPADLGRCLGEHPGKAVELLCGYLILHQAAAIVQRNHDRPAELAALVDNAAPDLLTNRVGHSSAPLAAAPSVPKGTSAVHPTPFGPLDAALLKARLACPGTALAARKCMPIETPTGEVRAVIVADMIEILDEAHVSRGYAEIYDLKRAGYPDDTCSTLGPEAAKLLAKRVADRLDAELRDSMEVA